MNKERRLHWLHFLYEFAEARKFSFDYRTEGYAEPGYKGDLIAFGNWNDITKYNQESRRWEPVSDLPGRIANLLEKLKVEIEWSDEWSFCDNCQRPFRISPDSYCWKPAYYEFSETCDRLCLDCAQENTDDIIEDLIGDDRKCLTLDISKSGFICLESGFEHGLHRGQAANPKTIADSLRKLGVERFFFVLDSTGQFDIEFSVWIATEELRKFDMFDWERAEKNVYPDPATMMDRALRDASQKMSKLEGDGIKYAKCNPDGTADVRMVSREEFVEGIKE